MYYSPLLCLQSVRQPSASRMQHVPPYITVKHWLAACSCAHTRSPVTVSLWLWPSSVIHLVVQDVCRVVSAVNGPPHPISTAPPAHSYCKTPGQTQQPAPGCLPQDPPVAAKGIPVSIDGLDFFYWLWLKCVWSALTRNASVPLLELFTDECWNRAAVDQDFRQQMCTGFIPV